MEVKGAVKKERRRAKKKRKVLAAVRRQKATCADGCPNEGGIERSPERDDPTQLPALQPRDTPRAVGGPCSCCTLMRLLNVRSLLTNSPHSTLHDSRLFVLSRSQHAAQPVTYRKVCCTRTATTMQLCRIYPMPASASVNCNHDHSAALQSFLELPHQAERCDEKKIV